MIKFIKNFRSTGCNTEKTSCHDINLLFLREMASEHKEWKQKLSQAHSRDKANVFE